MTLFFFDKQVLEKSVPILRDAVFSFKRKDNKLVI